MKKARLFGSGLMVIAALHCATTSGRRRHAAAAGQGDGLTDVAKRTLVKSQITATVARSWTRASVRPQSAGTGHHDPCRGRTATSSTHVMDGVLPIGARPDCNKPRLPYARTPSSASRSA